MLGLLLSGLFTFFANEDSHLARAFANLSALQSLALAQGIAALSLIASVAWAAFLRFFVSDIDGSRPKDGSALDLALRCVTNTTEQLLIFVIAATCIFASSPMLAPSFLPAVAIWFIFARILFFVGYYSHPLARSVGFAATFYPSLAMMAYGLWGFLR